MRTMTIEKTLYRFDELDDDAKEKARDALRDINVDFDWYEYVFDDAKRCGALLGIDVDRIYFSGFWSQGDGACFEGEYRYRKGWRKALRGEIGGDDLQTLERIGDDLQAVQKRAFYGVTASTIQRGRYMHEQCMSVSVNAETPAGDDICEGFESLEEDMTEALRDFACWIYRALEREYEYQTSDEAIETTIEANEYEFDEFGHLA